MRIPLNWLKKYISFSLSPERLAEDLTMTGTKLEALLHEKDEAVLDLEITSNRPDCLSLIGVAREVAAITGKKITLPKIKSETSIKKSQNSLFSIEIQDKKSCPLYSGRLIQNVTVKASLSHVQKNLELAGTRAINNVVDVTNFVLYEMGQPLHAFDYDKIKGGQIIVRRAKKNEKFLGLDDVEYALDESILVIADAERAIAIAGVMGGKLTEVTNETKNILLEAAYFDPLMVRQACRKTKISTESSYRFERNVDIQNVLTASARAVDLILESAGGKESGFSVAGSLKFSKPRTISFDLHEFNKGTGHAVSAFKIKEILESLGFKTSSWKELKLGKVKMGQVRLGQKLYVDVPSFRSDVTEMADLTEEVLRIEGFDKVKPSIPITHHSDHFTQDKKPGFLFELKKYLAGIGFYEISTYSLVSGKSLEQAGVSDLSRVQKIRNPLSVEQEYFRPTLLVGALSSLLFNAHRKAENLKFFEIGNVYENNEEKTLLSLAIYGETENNWKRKSASSFYDLKGAIENIVKGFLKYEDLQWSEKESLFFDSAVSIELASLVIGEAGILKGNISKNWDLSQNVYYAEINLNTLWTLLVKEKIIKIKTVSKYPVVRRDIAFIANKSVTVALLEAAMKEEAGEFLKEARLFDEFSGKNIPEGKRSLAFSLSYQKDSGTFTDDEIQRLQSKIGNVLKDRFQVEFR